MNMFEEDALVPWVLEEQNANNTRGLTPHLVGETMSVLNQTPTSISTVWSTAGTYRGGSAVTLDYVQKCWQQSAQDSLLRDTTILSHQMEHQRARRTCPLQTTSHLVIYTARQMLYCRERQVQDLLSRQPPGALCEA